MHTHICWSTTRPGLLTCRLSPTHRRTHARCLSSRRITRQGRTFTRNDFAEVQALCRRRGWALIADEVFADYPLEAAHPLTDIATATDVLSFSLAGLSKTVGLPQLKLGWMIVGGCASARTAALASLELIADTYLSVGTPVQIALPQLLRAGASVRSAIHDRVRHNLAVLRTATAAHPSCDVLRAEGGWSAVVRVPVDPA